MDAYSRRTFLKTSARSLGALATAGVLPVQSVFARL